MTADKVSIVISVLNGAATLERCLQSVFEQSWPHWQLVVMDGGSSDGTQAILETHAERIHYWESQPDRGIYHAWNKALEHVSGDWICFLGADDRFAGPDVLERLAPELDDATADCAVVYASVEVVDADGNVVLAAGRPWAEARAEFRERMAIPHQATFHHRSLFERHGSFDESYRICGDYELLLRELLDHDPRFVPDLVAVSMGAGGISDRPGTATLMTGEFERARYRHRLTRISPALSPRVWRARLRGGLTRLFGRRVADSVAGVYHALAGTRRP